MSVVLGEIPADGDAAAVTISADNYDAETLVIEQEDIPHDIILTRRQLQAMSIIVDRFMDR